MVVPFSTGYMEWDCHGMRDGQRCREVMKVWIRPALIHSQTGQQEACPKCGTWYAMTESVVLQIAAPEQSFIDAEGNPYGINECGQAR